MGRLVSVSWVGQALSDGELPALQPLASVSPWGGLHSVSSWVIAGLGDSATVSQEVFADRATSVARP